MKKDMIRWSVVLGVLLVYAIALGTAVYELETAIVDGECGNKGYHRQILPGVRT